MRTIVSFFLSLTLGLTAHAASAGAPQEISPVQMKKAEVKRSLVEIESLLKQLADIHARQSLAGIGIRTSQFVGLPVLVVGISSFITKGAIAAMIAGGGIAAVGTTGGVYYLHLTIQQADELSIKLRSERARFKEALDSLAEMAH